jgi:hypothetical protein
MHGNNGSVLALWLGGAAMSRFTLRRPEFLGSLAVPWTPAANPPDFWFKPVDSRLSLSGNSVISLSDYLENGKVVTAPAATNRPTMVQNGLGANNIITFDGVDDILSLASAGAAGLTSVYILAVMQFNAGGSSQDFPIIIGTAGSITKNRGLYRASNGTTLGYSGWQADIFTSTHAIDVGSFNLFGGLNTQLATPNNVQLEKNATITTHSTSPASLTTTVDGLAFGSIIGGITGYATSCQLAEAVVYYSSPTTDIRDRLRGYLAWEHGLQNLLPPGFIYKNSRPYL